LNRPGRIITQGEKEVLVRTIKKRMKNFSERTLGGKGLCLTPGMKIRSGGRGRGLARGRGMGPIGIPFFGR